MANNKWTQVKPGVGVKNFLILMAIGTAVIGSFAAVIRLTALRGK